MSMIYRIALKPKHVLNSYGQRDWKPVWPTQTYIDELKGWCKERCGTNGWNYYGQYRRIPYEFRFRRSEDFLAFKLTFGFHHEA